MFLASVMRCFRLLPVVFLLGWWGVGWGEWRDHHHVQRAVQSGQAKPLSEILALIAPQYPGEVLEVELEHEGLRHRTLVYEIKLLQPNGRIIKLKVDAQTGNLLSTRFRSHH